MPIILLGFKILTSYFLASWHVHLAGVYRVLQRTWRGKHQRQFCDYLWIVRWVGRLWISTIYRDKDPSGVSWLSLCTLVSCVCIQMNLTFSFVLIKMYVSIRIQKYSAVQFTSPVSNLVTIELPWQLHSQPMQQNHSYLDYTFACSIEMLIVLWYLSKCPVGMVLRLRKQHLLGQRSVWTTTNVTNIILLGISVIML